jgi:hypothetical protein
VATTARPVRPQGSRKLIPGLLADSYGVLESGDRFLQPLRGLQREIETLQHRALAMAVGGVAEDGDGALAGGDGLLEPAHLGQGEAEVARRRALTVPVAGLTRAAVLFRIRRIAGTIVTWLLSPMTSPRG